MQILGLTITRTKAVLPGQLQSVESRGGWWPVIRESFAGAWQQDVEVTLADVLTHPTVYACITLIASDVAKMRLRLVEVDANDIWTVTESPAFSPVLRKPNSYQTQYQFVEQWMLSKLIHGNTYVLKVRDQRGIVTGLFILDPQRCRPLVAPNGSVFYEIKRDDLSLQFNDQIIVPAREIIHDRMAPLYHPLVGKSPLHASGVSAMLGLRILNNSAQFFVNGSQPGGVLTVPGAISDETASRLKTTWESGFSGSNYGKVAVIADGLKYEPMKPVAAENSQLTEQWGKVSEAIASTFHVPFHLVGGPPPPYNNIQALTVQYFTQCIHTQVVQVETLLDEGLGLGPLASSPETRRLGTEFDIDDLLWMDSATMMAVLKDGIGAGILKPNEARAKLNLEPVDGGDTPYLQQQNFSLTALNRRDEEGPAPLVPSAQAAAPAADEPAPEEPAPEDEEDDVETARFIVALTKQLASADYAAEA